MKALLVLVFALAAACRRDADSRIADEYREMWDARGPALAHTPCPDADAKRARLAPLLQLASDASKTWHRFDQPLPAPLADRLTALDPAAAADDLRCLLVDPDTRPGGWVGMSTVAALLYRKGETAAADNKLDDGWRLITDSLRMYRNASAQTYVYFFQPAWILQRAATVADLHPPPEVLRAALLANAAAAVMPKTTLCDGLKEELLAHGASLFYGHVADLRPALLDRWGSELGELYTDDYAKRSRPSYEAWQAFRALWDAVSRDCAGKSPAELHRELTTLVAALKQHAPEWVQFFEVMMSRLDRYDELHAAETELRTRLAIVDPQRTR